MDRETRRLSCAYSVYTRARARAREDAGNQRPKISETSFLSMGSGQILADPFLAFISRVLWRASMPDVKIATLGVYWALAHAIKYAPGGIGEPIRVAVLRRQNGTWKATLVEEDELQEQAQHIDAIEERIGRYPADIIESAPTQPIPAPPAPPRNGALQGRFREPRPTNLPFWGCRSGSTLAARVKGPPPRTNAAGISGKTAIVTGAASGLGLGIQTRRAGADRRDPGAIGYRRLACARRTSPASGRASC
jgi:hypothetical protein